ncbi:ATP-binding protein [Actinomadura luteofluorescens]|uniref:ATP-binding protein n=1 Tax=Actinomadura luteofluorescens TaxID=46163 RepID=UPI00363F0448
MLRDRVAFWSVLAEDEGRSCELIGAEGPAPLPIPGTELAAAVDALLGNIFRHTAEGTGFVVTLHQGQGVTGILVADGGPGIADPDAALKRGSSGGGSTGLGLDIARRAAESTGATCASTAASSAGPRCRCGSARDGCPRPAAPAASSAAATPAANARYSAALNPP